MTHPWPRRAARGAILISASLAFGFLNAGAAANAGPHSARSSTAANRTYLVLLVLDGARPDYFRLASTPNLHWLMARGTTYTQAFVGQLMANTPPGHASIGTGLFPSHHGIPDFAWKDPS